MRRLYNRVRVAKHRAVAEFTRGEIEDRGRQFERDWRSGAAAALAEAFAREQPAMSAAARQKGLELFDDEDALMGHATFIWSLVKEAQGGALATVLESDFNEALRRMAELYEAIENEAELRAEAELVSWALNFPHREIMLWLAREFSEEGLEGRVEMTPVNSVEAFDWLCSCLKAMNAKGGSVADIGRTQLPPG